MYLSDFGFPRFWDWITCVLFCVCWQFFVRTTVVLLLYNLPTCFILLFSDLFIILFILFIYFYLFIIIPDIIIKN